MSRPIELPHTITVWESNKKRGIYLPAEVCRRLGIHAGDILLGQLMQGGVYTLRRQRLTPLKEIPPPLPSKKEG